ncbi:M16 family metallopeptidase [Prevotella intermedia]|uniref:Peptidase M16 n=1 Tax=Prevotella intermedia TaxID=28131 RepID=A0A2G8IBF8_PREIN|nr:M16 family metallopeptidase [Prevotella intermedia]PIK20864.1 peptidase M16 [Prevotella intermedia]
MLKNLSFGKIGLSLLLLLGVVGIKAQTRTYESVPNDPMKTRIYTLDNGLKVYISVNKEKPRIQTYIAVRTGSRNDPAETTGLAHYLEHIMFKGTDKVGTSNYEAERPYLKQIEKLYEEYRHMTDPAKRKVWYHKIDSVSQIAAQYNIPNEYDKLMAAIGSQGTNAYTSNDVTCYVENIPSNEIESWAKVQGDRFQNMVIRGFHTELEAVYEEYNMGLTSDGRKLFTALMAKLFPNHPYGTQTTIGRGEHLKNPSITNIMNYYHRYYVPNNIAICMSGDLNPEQTVAIIEKYFGNWKRSETLSAPQYGAQPKFTAPVDTTVVGLEAEMLYLGWRADKGNSLQCDTLDIIGELLSNGSAGLYDLNLNRTMKVQSAGAGFSELTDYSMFIAMGIPKKGQTLQEVRDLLLAEIEKLKKGDFSDDLLPSVINNYKRSYYTSLDNNKFRAKAFVDAFINNVDWKQEVDKLNRISKMTKAEIVSFANRFFDNGYAAVYKVQGTDTTIQKVDKPKITPIPTNNDKHSAFLQEIVKHQVEPIKPVFVDFKKDLTKSTTKKGWPILYKQNTQDDLFTLYLEIPFGKESDLLPGYAKMYIDYLGTDKMTNAQIKQELYKLACDYDIGQTDDETYFKLTGLNENLPKALALINDVIDNAKVDKEAYAAAVDLLIKSQKDKKADQKSNFRALQDYGMYGAYNSTRNILSEEQLKNMDPQKLLNSLKGLKNYKQTVLYYGPSSLKDIDNLLSKTFKTAKKFTPLPKEKRYTLQATPKNEILIAPYDAKNIYMVQFHNENKEWNPNDAAKIAVFNEYFGGGMNAIVFQEMREARALAYSASASYRTPSRLGDKEYFNTYIITQNDKMMDCVAQFNELLNNVPVRQANFDLAKQNLLKSFASARTTKFSILSAYMAAQKMGLDYSLSEKIYKDLPSVTLNDIINFEKTNMANKTFKYLILGDEKELDMKALEKIAPIKRVTTEEIFGY